MVYIGRTSPEIDTSEAVADMCAAAERLQGIEIDMDHCSWRELGRLIGTVGLDF